MIRSPSALDLGQPFTLGLRRRLVGQDRLGPLDGGIGAGHGAPLSIIATSPRRAEAGDQGVDIVVRGVEADRGASARGQAEPLVQRHGAVMAGTDGDPVEVQQRPDVLRVARRPWRSVSTLHFSRAVPITRTPGTWLSARVA